ncbi:MAG: hypothetical protein MUF01_17940 [Bryobacterales bacterium]|jgi:hypothetical protein|nr:hypothetical protein [Bryobacterales bacterium]
MQVVHAGVEQLIVLELDVEFLENVARQAGFACVVHDEPRFVTLELTASERSSPLLLFDASSPTNTGWFSRCQFYIDGSSGRVLQTPLVVANRRERNGKVNPFALRLQIAKELPVKYKLPGHAQVTEQSMYALVFNFLLSVVNNGVGVCGGPVVKPLTD